MSARRPDQHPGNLQRQWQRTTFDGAIDGRLRSARPTNRERQARVPSTAGNGRGGQIYKVSDGYTIVAEGDYLLDTTGVLWYIENGKWRTLFSYGHVRYPLNYVRSPANRTSDYYNVDPLIFGSNDLEVNEYPVRLFSAGFDSYVSGDSSTTVGTYLRVVTNGENIAMFGSQLHAGSADDDPNDTFASHSGLSMFGYGSSLASKASAGIFLAGTSNYLGAKKGISASSLVGYNNSVRAGLSTGSTFATSDLQVFGGNNRFDAEGKLAARLSVFGQANSILNPDNESYATDVDEWADVTITGDSNLISVGASGTNLSKISKLAILGQFNTIEFKTSYVGTGAAITKIVVAGTGNTVTNPLQHIVVVGDGNTVEASEGAIVLGSSSKITGERAWILGSNIADLSDDDNGILVASRVLITKDPTQTGLTDETTLSLVSPTGVERDITVNDSGAILLDGVPITGGGGSGVPPGGTTGQTLTKFSDSDGDADWEDGAVGMTWQGTWSSATAYSTKDGVYYNGSSYIAILPGTNHNPASSPTYWDLLAQKGDTGAAGSDGTNGTNGTNGSDGADGADGDSAYEVAVANGFVGTESEWLDSLVGVANVMVVVNHGAVSSVARPTGATAVYWVGSVEPDNKEDGDLWMDVS